MTRLTAKDYLGVEVQVVIARAVVAKNQGHLEQAQVMVAAAAAGKLGGTQRCLLLKIYFDSPDLSKVGSGNLNFRAFLTMGCLRRRWLKVPNCWPD